MSTKLSKSDQIKELVSQIETQLDGYVTDIDKLIEFHTFRSQMSDKYSMKNCALIESQFKGAIKVAGYNQWKNEGYYVKKGEKSLKILAPFKKKMVSDLNGKEIVALKYANKETKAKLENNEYKLTERIGFNPVPVFDIHQTSCPIEEYPEYIQQFYLIGQTEKFQELYDSLENYRQEINVGRYSDENKPNVKQSTAKGFYVPSQHSIWVDSNLDQKQYLKTTIHELAHAKMHRNSDIPSELKEYQAELTAGVVSNYFGLGATETSTHYIFSHIQNMEIKDKEKLVEEVLTISNEMIGSMEKYLEKEHGLTKDIGKEINDIVALEKAEGITNEIPNNMIDYLERDSDLDGVSDRYDVDDRDSTVQTFADLDEREKKSHSVSLNQRMDDILGKSSEAPERDRGEGDRFI